MHLRLVKYPLGCDEPSALWIDFSDDVLGWRRLGLKRRKAK
jgi:hypothetical protein